MHLSHAQWIWLDQSDRQPYNQTIIARKTIDLPAFTEATLAITVDSQYRLFINGRWVEDGPCRSWPRHFQYDLLDVTHLLHSGRNVVAVVARHYGMSTFHQVPQEAGLLAQLEVITDTGEQLLFASDASWKVRESPAHIRQTARISIQMAQVEWYDATLELAGATSADFDDSAWQQARAYYPAEDGPWQDLHPRDVRFLTREPLSPRIMTEASVVTDLARVVAFDLKRLNYPDDRSANVVPIVGALATVLVSDREQDIAITFYNPHDVKIACRGQEICDGMLHLVRGANLLTATVGCVYGHHLYDLTLTFDKWEGVTAHSPLGEETQTPWVWAGPFAVLNPVTNLGNVYTVPIPADASAKLACLLTAENATAFLTFVGDNCRAIPQELLLNDSFPAFFTRRVLHSAETLVEHHAALLADNQEWTTVKPADDGDVELCLDFGKEVVGWVEFEMVAPAGTVVDAHLIEYRNGDDLQHTRHHRNGFRYIAKGGLNHFTSMKRMAGRYLFLTLRGMTAPVKIRLARMLQATYPVEQRGMFRCSDLALNRIWEISAYTLRLCMEDTYTDCPLYEQTLWVGDARNESLYNAICFGADDLTLRCLRLSAQSMDTLPMVGCQVPSGWDVILPAWSFMWGMNVWEYFFSSGDRQGLVELYPAVMQNLRAAHALCTDHGLFSANEWNLFDWAGIDDKHRTVLHNSLFLIGAIDAATKCCETLGAEDGPWLTSFRTEVTAAILVQWNAEKGSYPDALRNDGTVSPSTSQHTSALALLYDVLPEDAREIAVRHIIDPPEGMVRVGSPFALQFFLEALERVGDAGHALQLIRRYWQDMLDFDASTCWETFRGFEQCYPSRSHCHAWSSAPVYVLNRLVLGIVPVAVGATEVVVSPHPLDLTWAEGASASPQGDLHVAWRREEDTLSLTVNMPDGVRWRVEPNDDWQGITRVLVNGEECPELSLFTAR